MREGICVAGNMMVDITYPISGWPRQGELVHIRDGITRSTGGAVCNVLGALAKLDDSMPLYAMGRVGEDAEGDLILSELDAFPNIHRDCIIREGISSFTNVMSDLQNKQRTFFTYMGANARFSEADIDWDRVPAKLFHIGYIMLLDALDAPDEVYGSRMARLLHAARAHGLKTSIDVVSEASDRFRQLVPPALRYADYCVINEYEAEQTTGIPLREADGMLLAENLPRALKAMKTMGVSTWAVIHCPEGGYGLDEDDHFVTAGSLILPAGYIQGSVGAGDVFCAGVLYGAEKGWALDKAIDLGIAAAAASLSDTSATAGVRPVDQTLDMFNKYDRRLA